MLRPIFDRRMRVLRRGLGGRYDTVAPELAAVPCTTGQRETGLSNFGAGSSGRADTVVENVLIWDPAADISENMRVQFTAKRVAGRWQQLDLTKEPRWIMIEGTLAAPEVNGVLSHRQARIAREGG